MKVLEGLGSQRVSDVLEGSRIFGGSQIFGRVSDGSRMFWRVSDFWKGLRARIFWEGESVGGVSDFWMFPENEFITNHTKGTAEFREAPPWMHAPPMTHPNPGFYNISH